MKKVELLAPAGSFESLKAAINAGADAVYIGGKSFGARAFADNPDNALLIKGIEYCHLHNKKLYLTVNTLLKNKELKNELFEFIKPLYLAGVDAVIVQDEGVMEFLSEVFPKLPIHISTQASVVCSEGADYFKERYTTVERVVPARELSIEELKRFKQDSELELEVFIHGALCYCYSGQCLLSSMIGGRSGNRGRCAQPCRKLYNGKYLLSPKDLCTVYTFDKLLDIGIDSFKIEGRMKSPQYTAGVVNIYRELIDKYYEVKESGGSFDDFRKENSSFFDFRINLLKDLFNRGGFTEGYLNRLNSFEMMSFERPNHSGVKVGEVINVRGREAVIRFTTKVEKQDVLEIRDKSDKSIFEFTLGASYEPSEVMSVLTLKGVKAQTGTAVFRTKNSSLFSTIEEQFISTDKRIPVRIHVCAREGEKLYCSFSIRDSVEFSAYGGVVMKALKQPIGTPDIEKQFMKLGNTPFRCEAIGIDSTEDIFISVSEMNNLRREACEGLLQKKISMGLREESSINYEGLEHFMTSYFEAGPKPAKERITVAACRTIEQLKACIDHGSFGRIYYNISSFDQEDIDAALYCALSSTSVLYIALPYICRYDIIDNVRRLMSEYKNKAAFLIRNREELSLALKEGVDFRIDYNVYASNNASVAKECAARTLCTELTAVELSELNCSDRELIVYGYQPVMFSAQCVYKNLHFCCRSKADNSICEITDELGYSFKTLQMCSFCYNIIYNSACLNISGEASLIDRVDPTALRYDFVFESPEDIINSLKNMPERFEAPQDINYTNGHFKRTVD